MESSVQQLWIIPLSGVLVFLMVKDSALLYVDLVVGSKAVWVTLCNVCCTCWLRQHLSDFPVMRWRMLRIWRNGKCGRRHLSSVSCTLNCRRMIWKTLTPLRMRFLTCSYACIVSEHKMSSPNTIFYHLTRWMMCLRCLAQKPVPDCMTWVCVHVSGAIGLVCNCEVYGYVCMLSNSV